MQWWLALLIGMGAGLVILLVFIPIITLVKNTKERIKVKRMIKRGDFLQPLDPKDYNAEKWKDKIDIEANKTRVDNLNEQIFKNPNKFNQDKKYVVEQ